MWSSRRSLWRAWSRSSQEGKARLSSSNSSCRDPLTSGGRAVGPLAAFANGVGGNLLSGVDDSGSMVGVNAEDASGTGTDTIARWIIEVVIPHLDLSVESVGLAGGRWVVQVVVQEGAAPPYGVSPTNPSY